MSLLSKRYHRQLMDLPKIISLEKVDTEMYSKAPSGSRSTAYHDFFQFSGGNVTLISDMNAWDQKLSEAKTLGKIVIANFSASLCRESRSVSPNYISLSEKYPSLMFLTINAYKLTMLRIKWNLEVTPTFIFLKDGKQIDKLEGADNRKLLKKIKTALDSQVIKNQPVTRREVGV
ncbi:hypothetical protein E3N88_40612 [Mikania micrantha]|uniref:Thioredoxin domain-containing protein n=1 Tax=Mikania micrantha TaxID=192012 RepID=A0A5N6LN80_9ASTR|nr:hypothetical protein E3N88_40612 [Mikania micrantha]